MASLEILEDYLERGLNLFINCPFFSPDILPEGHQKGLDLGFAHGEVARHRARLLGLLGHHWPIGEGMRVLIGSALLRILVELLLDEVLVLLPEGGAIGRLGDSLILGQQVVEVQLPFLHSL